jgi:hypothetical protein
MLALRAKRGGQGQGVQKSEVTIKHIIIGSAVPLPQP